MVSEPQRLIVVGTDRLFRDCLRTALEGAGDDLAVVGELGGDGAAVAAAVVETTPDLVLVDLTGDDGWARDLVARLAAEAPEARVLLLGNGAEDRAVGCIEAGARGYLPRDAGLEDLRRAIRRIADGEVVCPPGLAFSTFRRLAELSRRVRKSDRLEALKLTPREIEVLGLVADGLSNRTIADRLSLSVYTIKNHVHHILEKLEVDTRADAARHAVEHGWLRARHRRPRLVARREE